MSKLMTIDDFETFELQEAIKLINKTVLMKEDGEFPVPGIGALGVISGVLTLNEEVEVVIKLIDRVTQMTKQEYSNQIERVIDDDIR
ncbi:MAG: hypothetical protein KUG75_06210 [Pseudomonadales bacterium]|nr:hypothetical protein [Pseudomonadales bacterium]